MGDDFQSSALPELPKQHEEMIRSGVFIRHSRLPPFDGVGYFRMQYVLNEKMFFAVNVGNASPRIFRAVYLLVPVWGFHNQVGNRVVGYEVFDRGHPGPGPLEEWNCAPDPTDTVRILFGESVEGLSGAIVSTD